MKAALIGFEPAPASEVPILYRLIYRSEETTRAADPFGDDLLSLVAMSAQKNATNNLTGVLLYHPGQPGRFLQILEGSITTLESTFERVCRDRRHRKIVLLEFTIVDQRRFGHWAMTLSSFDPLRGATVINLALEGIAGEGGSEILVDEIAKAFDTQPQPVRTPPKREIAARSRGAKAIWNLT